MGTINSFDFRGAPANDRVSRSQIVSNATSLAGGNVIFKGNRPIPRLSVVVLLVFLLSRPLLAQTAPMPAAPAAAPTTNPADTNARLAKLEQQVADAKSSADNAWMLTSSALVLMMTGPGLALFYGGLVRKKNVLGTMMQSFALMAAVTVMWG